MTQSSNKLSFRKQLIQSPELNPFNDKFNWVKFRNEYSATIPSELFNDGLLFAPVVLAYMNGIYKDYYATFKEQILISNVRFPELVDLLFALFNRNFILIQHEKASALKKYLQSHPEIHQEYFYSYKVNAMDEKVGQVEAQAALELDIDAFIFAINYLRYFENTSILIDPALPKLQPISVGQTITFFSAFFALLKGQYDNSVWNNGTWKIEEGPEKKKLYISYPDESLLIIQKVGLLRMQQNINSNHLTQASQFIRESPFSKFLIRATNIHKHENKLKKVWVENGQIRYSLAKKANKNDSLGDIRNYVEMATFYMFMENTTFPKFKDLSITDLVTLFGLVQELIRLTLKVDFNDGISSMDDVKEFPIKIKRTDLFEYLSRRSIYSNQQINAFLNVISYRFGDRVNFWDRPLVQYKDDLYICFLQIVNPILLNLIDHWLEQGEFSLDKRGKLLENYLKEFVQETFREKQYFLQLPKGAKIYNKHKKHEEVDFVLNLKTVVVVGEVKCIKFPFEARDHHNAFRILKNAATQVNRKLEFIRQNIDDLEDQLGPIKGKSLIPLVITNYPIYTSYAIDGVAVADVYLFENYFDSGQLSQNRLNEDGTSQEISVHRYYNTETEMCDNLASFFLNPYPVEMLKPLYHIETRALTVVDPTFEVYVNSAQIK